MDVALLGRETPGFQGDCELAVFTFRILSEGDPGLRITTLEARDHTNSTRPVSIEPGLSRPLPSVTMLFAPSPNPSRNEARIGFSLVQASSVRIDLFSVDGRFVRSLADGAFPAGEHSVKWDGRDASGHWAPAGVYFVNARLGGQRSTRRLVRVP